MWDLAKSRAVIFRPRLRSSRQAYHDVIILCHNRCVVGIIANTCDDVNEERSGAQRWNIHPKIIASRNRRIWLDRGVILSGLSFIAARESLKESFGWLRRITNVLWLAAPFVLYIFLHEIGFSLYITYFYVYPVRDFVDPYSFCTFISSFWYRSLIWLYIFFVCKRCYVMCIPICTYESKFISIYNVSYYPYFMLSYISFSLRYYFLYSFYLFTIKIFNMLFQYNYFIY